MSAKCQYRTSEQILRSPFDSRIDLAAKCPKIDGLGEKRSALLQRFGFGLGITIGRDHDDGNVRPYRFRLRQQFKAAHSWHVDVRQDQDDLASAASVIR